jgi:hypothetical protein
VVAGRDASRFKTGVSEEGKGIAAKVIISDTADRKRGEALLHDLIAKVGGSSAELAASGEHIPEELPKSDYRILHLHAYLSLSHVSQNMSWDFDI